MAGISQIPPLPDLAPVVDDKGKVTSSWREFFRRLTSSINGLVDGVVGDLTFDSLTVSGDMTSTKGTISATAGDVTSGKDVTAARHLTVGSNATIGGNLTAGGDASVGGNLDVTGSATVDSLASTGAISGTDITGDSLDVTGDVAGATATISGEASVGSLASDGAISGTAITGDSLDVTGEVEGATLNITSDADVAGDLDVTDGINIGGALDYAGVAGVSGGDLRVAGNAYFDGYVRSMASMFGRGIDVRESVPEATLYYNIGATFTAATRTIYKAGETFLSDGVSVGDYMVTRSASDSSYIGATAEVIAVTEETIVISIASSGSHTVDDLTDFDFTIHPHPMFFVLDHGDTHFKIGPNLNASFKVWIPVSNNIHGLYFDVTAGVNGNHGIGMDYDPDTYSGCAAMRINADATALDAAADRLNIHSIVVDNVGATGGEVHGVSLSVSDPTNADLETCAVLTNPGVNVICQHIGTPAALAAGFSHTGSTYTDRTTAFGSAVTNVQLFGANNDYIYLASANKFDEIIVLLATPASQTIIPTFEYVTDAGAWVAFVPVDSTNGFSQNGSVRYNSAALATWGVRTINEVTGAAGADDYYWVRIRRTRAVLPTPPTESTIQVLALGADFSWDKSGNARINTIGLTDGVTAPDAVVGQAFIYVDTADGDLKVKFGDGTVKTLATD